MTKEKLFLLDVLSCFIRKEKLNFDTELDWQELLRLAHIHSVAGILGCMAMENPCEKTAEILPELKKQCLSNLAAYAQRGEKTEEMSRKLSAEGIDHMLFKGSVLRRLYPVPELRSFSDADMLIKPGDRQKSHALMLKLGFAVKEDWEPVYSYYKENELYELHTEMLDTEATDKADFRAYFASAWEHAAEVGEHRFEPAPEFHFLYLLTHIAKHIKGAGAGVRMYMDAAVFLLHYGESLDWSYIEEELQKLRLRDFASCVLAVTEKYFGTESPLDISEVSPETAERLMDFTLDGGLFGGADKDSGLVVLKNSGEESRTKTVLREAFPAAETIERRYTYLQGRHWLLPVAWMHRVIKNRRLWGERAAEVKSIMQTDEDKVQSLRELYKEIGL